MLSKLLFLHFSNLACAYVGERRGGRSGRVSKHRCGQRLCGHSSSSPCPSVSAIGSGDCTPLVKLALPCFRC